MNDDAKKVLELLKQEDMIKDGLANGSGPWTVVYDSWSNDDGNIDGCWYAVFAQPDQREEILSKSEWDFKIGDACPGFSQESQKSEIVYSRRKKESIFEPIIILQEFDEVVPDKCVVSEEFCLLMNIWLDPESGDYYVIGSDAPIGPVIQFEDKKVKVRTSILRSYQAARQLDLVLFVRSDVIIQYPDSISIESSEHQTGLSHMKLECFSYLDVELKHSSCLEMKHVVPPLSQNESGIGPWKKKPEEYLEFIIGKDENGKNTEYTCNPAELYDGYKHVNSDVPYHKPIFFMKGVLDKYANSPFYTIESYALRYGDKWSVPIRYDQNHQGNIIVSLGDIGKHIPSVDWLHWKTYNIPPID